MPALTVAKLVAAGTLRRLPWGSEEDEALRTTHNFTATARLHELTAFVDKWKTHMLGDKSADPQVMPRAPPLSLFDGTAADISKQVSFKAVANQLHEEGCITCASAVELFSTKSASYRW